MLIQQIILKKLMNQNNISLNSINAMVQQNCHFRNILRVKPKNLHKHPCHSFYLQAIILYNSSGQSKCRILGLAYFHFKIHPSTHLRLQIYTIQIHSSCPEPIILHIYHLQPSIIYLDLILGQTPIILNINPHLNISKCLDLIFVHFSSGLHIYHHSHIISLHIHVFYRVSIHLYIFHQYYNDKYLFHVFFHLKMCLHIYLCQHKQSNLYFMVYHSPIIHHILLHFDIVIHHFHSFCFLSINRNTYPLKQNNKFLFHSFSPQANFLHISNYLGRKIYQIHVFYLFAIHHHISLHFYTSKLLFLIFYHLGTCLETFSHLHKCTILRHQIYHLSTFPYRHLDQESYILLYLVYIIGIALCTLHHHHNQFYDINFLNFPGYQRIVLKSLILYLNQFQQNDFEGHSYVMDQGCGLLLTLLI